MYTALFTPFIVATVLLVPKQGVDFIPMPKKINKEKAQVVDDNLSIVLKKPKLIKVAKNSKKTKKKNKKHVEETPSEDDSASTENFDAIYKSEVKLLESKKIKKPAPTTSAEYRYPDAVPEQDLLAKVEKKYKTQFVEMKLAKEVTQAILDKTKSYKGRMAIGPSGLFKMDIEEPDKSSLIMDGKNIWVVDYPVDDAQNKVQILHSKARKKLKNQTFLSSLLGGGELLKNFKIDGQTKEKHETKFKLIPKEKDLEIQKVELSVDNDDELITVVAYWDQLGNKTELKFSKQEFKDDVPKDYFKFQPPKNSDVTEM
jgi:outer membrane lipoprotein carrier protein